MIWYRVERDANEYTTDKVPEKKEEGIERGPTDRGRASICDCETI
jgi:hypothetical protein